MAHAIFSDPGLEPEPGQAVSMRICMHTETHNYCASHHAQLGGLVEVAGDFVTASSHDGGIDGAVRHVCNGSGSAVRVRQGGLWRWFQMFKLLRQSGTCSLAPPRPSPPQS